MSKIDGERGIRVVGRPKRRRGKPQRERGAVLVVTAILLPVLIGMVALSVDVGYLYYRGLQLQRVADSAALAGVTRMPRFADASAVARDVAKRNGFETGTDGIVVTPQLPGTNNKRLKVSIRDNDVDSFFVSLFNPGWRLEKTAVAEYISNIPLGSVENAIGTGNLDDGSITPQNFWLAVSGPCAPKEAGDQISSRYDGNLVNDAVGTPAYAAGDVGKKAILCDVQEPQITDRQALILSRQTAKNTAVTGLFPALSLNRDYDFKGYNYIVDVPCNPAVPGGESPPPPCTGGGQTLGTNLAIQVYDPVFNPDAIQRYMQGMAGADGENRFLVEEKGDPLKPDKFGLLRTVGSLGCHSGNLAACSVSTGTANPRAEDVRVTTEFRIYPPDESPVDYDDDEPLTLSGSWVASSGLPAEEVNRVARFGSCQRWTDEWTAVAPDSNADGKPELRTRTDLDHDGVPDAIAPPYVAEPGPTTNPTMAVTGGYDATVCPLAASKWVTIATIAAGSPRGRYRVNVRTADALNSFGTNAFSLRSEFDADGDPTTFVPCGDAAAVSVGCPATSGDTSMSVFANVNDVSRFYLAKLSPPALYRNKTVIVQLWDPGEGADSIEVLRPIRTDEACSTREGDYCVQTFSWRVWNPGFNVWSTATPGSFSTDAYQDVCAGMTVQENKTILSVRGGVDSVEGCSNSYPSVLKLSRNGSKDRAGAPSGKFNDRLVAIQIQIPRDYGCAAGTGTSSVACVDLAAADVPESGWWKIRYTPTVDSGGNPVRITDRTTWTVQLLGDPVHLVRE